MLDAGDFRLYSVPSGSVDIMEKLKHVHALLFGVVVEELGGGIVPLRFAPRWHGKVGRRGYALHLNLLVKFGFSFLGQRPLGCNYLLLHKFIFIDPTVKLTCQRLRRKKRPDLE